MLRSFAGSVFWHTRGFRIRVDRAPNERKVRNTALIGNTCTGADPPRNPGYEAPSCLRSCPAPALRRLSDVAESHQESHVGDGVGDVDGFGDVGSAPNLSQVRHRVFVLSFGFACVSWVDVLGLRRTIDRRT